MADYYHSKLHVDELYELEQGHLLESLLLNAPRVAVTRPHLADRVFAPRRHVDADRRRTLDDDGGVTEANVAVLLGLSGVNAGGAGTDMGHIIGGGTHRVTDLGFLATVVAVAAALTCIPGAGGTSVLGATVLLLLFVLAVAGVSLIAAGLSPTASAAAARALLAAAQPALTGTPAFARRNVPDVAVSAASSAATGILASAAQPVLCFVCFALFLLSISLATAGLASGTG